MSEQEPVLLTWEETKSTRYANGNRTTLGRARVEGGWIYEFARWTNVRGDQPFAVFVPDQPNTTKPAMECEPEGEG